MSCRIYFGKKPLIARGKLRVFLALWAVFSRSNCTVWSRVPTFDAYFVNNGIKNIYFVKSIFVVVVHLHWVVSTNTFSEFTNHQLSIVSSSTWSKHGKFLLRVNRLLTACFSFLSDSMKFETCKYEIARLGTTHGLPIKTSGSLGNPYIWQHPH